MMRLDHAPHGEIGHRRIDMRDQMKAAGADPGAFDDDIGQVDRPTKATRRIMTSRASMREHWQSGLDDTRRTLKRKEWLAMPEDGKGIVVHDVHRERDY